MGNLLAPRSFPGAEGIVSVATGSVQATMQLSAVIAEKIKHKHSQKRAIFFFRPSRVPCLRAAGHSSLSNPLPRGPRPGRPSPECQSGLWG